MAREAWKETAMESCDALYGLAIVTFLRVVCAAELVTGCVLVGVGCVVL